MQKSIYQFYYIFCFSCNFTTHIAQDIQRTSKLCPFYVEHPWTCYERPMTSVYRYPLHGHQRTSSGCPKYIHFIFNSFGRIMDVYCIFYLEHSSDVRHRIHNGSKLHLIYINKSICDICTATHKFN